MGWRGWTGSPPVVQAEAESRINWRDAAAYAPLFDADRSFFAWEWLRRDEEYRKAATRALSLGHERDCEDAAAAFGLVGFERPWLAVPHARPLWRSDAHPRVLAVERSADCRPGDCFALDRFGKLATLLAGDEGEHLLLSDGARGIRLDAPPGTFGNGPVCLRYRLEGLAGAEPLVLTLRRLLALCRTGCFLRSLHQREPRARRWILMLRTWDGLAMGADQRQIAEVLLSRSAAAPRWRNRESSVRSQAQRLVRSARGFAAGGYLALLDDRAISAESD